MSSTDAQIDTTIEVVTPENIAFHYRVAGPFRRLPALIVDVAICVFLLWILGLVATLLSIAFGSAAEAVTIIGFFFLFWFYGGLFETFMDGQTLGKRMLGIRVVSTNGQPINGHQAIVRNILRIVDVLVGAGLVSMAMTRRFQRLGDLACHTMVVVEERPWFTGVVTFEDPRAFQLASYLPSDLQVSRSMARAIAHYAERRRYFQPARRREVASHIAKPLLEQFRLPADTSYDLLLCSMYYRLFIADRRDDEAHAAQAEAALGIFFPPPRRFSGAAPGP